MTEGGGVKKKDKSAEGSKVRFGVMLFMSTP